MNVFGSRTGGTAVSTPVSLLTQPVRVSVIHEIEIPSANEKDLLVEELTTNGVLDLICALEVIVFTLLMITMNLFVNQTRRAKQRISLKSFLENFFDVKKTSFFSRFSRLGIMLLFFRFFLMLYGLLVANSIQTKKTVIDRNRIITNPDQLFDSSYEFCLAKDEDLYQVFRSMPKNSVQRRLFERHREGDCSVDINASNGPISLTKRVRKLTERSIQFKTNPST